ncbi:pyrroline-5-carboxylate reductase [Alkalihalobacterium alkalinitrilicum]|uniref:pyrroline-5-carboxylate reductase n=1 Tax=Alkalihalobacterium alkalinitrilicum TaxID=427920 RepID=UPI00099517DA|nr:pyrroline-5-carboxylate reductase [Alkalihalobacterium alkalinitrilicum]
MLENKKVTFVGAGSMAEAIFAGLIKKDLLRPEQIIATNKQDIKRLEDLQNMYSIHTTTSKEEAVSEADIVILAMKPSTVVDGIESIKPYIHKKQIFISILAGVTTSYLEELLGIKAPVIRSMPNTSAKVGESATALSAGIFASEKDTDISAQLFKAIGTVHIIPEDKQDAFTGVAGSGPAYIYYFVEAMENAAKDLGLDDEEAKEVIIQTLKGSLKRLESTSKTSAQLYKEVMSPNGATEAALGVLASYQFQEAVTACVKRSSTRAKELGQIFIETK